MRLSRIARNLNSIKGGNFMKFGDKVRLARIKAKLTQQEFANKIGVSLRTVTNYEAGTCYPRKREIYRKISDVLDVDINYLLTEDEEFIINAGDKYGKKGASQAAEIINQTRAMFAGGELSEDDARAFIDEIQILYLESKERAKRFTPNKYTPTKSDKYK